MDGSVNRERALQFVKGFFETHDPIATQLAVRFAFRRRFQHCVRCAFWGRRIAMAEGADVETVEISALFHDIGKGMASSSEQHGKVGARICDQYLQSMGAGQSTRDFICGIILRHSEHARDPMSSLEEKVVSDADLLDETGAISILWDAMACAGEDAPSYDKAYERSLRSRGNLAALPGRLHTVTARKILDHRLALIDSFLENLADELGRS